MQPVINPNGHVPVGTGQQIPTAQVNIGRGVPARQVPGTGVPVVVVKAVPQHINPITPVIVPVPTANRRPAGNVEVHQAVGSDAVVVTKTDVQKNRIHKS